LTVGLFAWGAKLVLARQLGVGEFFALVQMTGGFMGAMLGFTGTLLAAVLMRPQLTVARALLAAPAEPAPSRQGVRTLTGPVVLENVWFRYDDDAPWVLRDFDLRVEAGEKRWLKAPSGFGKSTILRLMSGLLSPQQGQIRIAGQSPRSVRDLVLYLPQSVHLFGGSIYENLRLLSIDAPRERLLEAAQASGLHAFVSTLPMTYETVLPRGGGSLSGGQRQLIALTAMMASDRPLLLLDEALANLDWISRSWISRSSWFDYKTVVYASHDARIGLDESGATDLALAAQARRERQER
jgi:ABC-type bacteriocin/lantibiotic exporter with double-glycine peptidase domain